MPSRSRYCTAAPGHKDGAFQPISALAIELVGDSRDQVMTAGNCLSPGVQEREAARPVGGFDHTGTEAGLADQSGLLVAGDASDVDRRAECRGGAEHASGIADVRQHGAGNVEQRQQFVIPGTTMDVEQQRARCVGGVGRVFGALGQAP